MSAATNEAAKPKNAAKVKKAIDLGKSLKNKDKEITKADITRQMWPLVKDESRDVIVDAFVKGAGLTPMGAQTYFYNCRRAS